MAVQLVNDMFLRERVICFDQVSQQVGINVVHHKVSGVAGPITDADVAAARSQSHANPYKTWLSSRSSYRGVGVQIIGPDNRYPEVLNGDFAGVGTGGATQLPLQVSGLIRINTSTYLTGATNKKYLLQGRIYPPFPSRAWSDDEGAMTPVGRGQLEGIAATFPLVTTIVAGAGTATIRLYVVPANPVLTPAEASQVLALLGFATQRRRGEFGKTNSNPIP